MKTYITKIWMIKMSPPLYYGGLPNIGKKKLLQKYHLTEKELEQDKTKTGYYVPLNKFYVLEVIEKKGGKSEKNSNRDNNTSATLDL